MPNELHQLSLIAIVVLLREYRLDGKSGIVLCSPFKLKLNMPSKKYREPDIAFLKDRNDPRRGNEFWTGADVVMEIVSPGGRKRDLVLKRRLYAESAAPLQDISR